VVKKTDTMVKIIVGIAIYVKLLHVILYIHSIVKDVVLMSAQNALRNISKLKKMIVAALFFKGKID